MALAALAALVPRAAAANPYGMEPYPVFWAVNGPNASAFGAGGSVDIAQYGIKTNNFTVCGGMTGAIMPRLSADGAPIRGGVPQSANFSVSVFLAGLSQAIAARIPDPQYDGLAVFDFEAFTPIWSEDTGAGGWHSKAYRTYSVKLVRQAHPTWTAAQVEAQAILEFETAATQLFVSALEQGKKLRPKALWGFYGMRTQFACPLSAFPGSIPARITRLLALIFHRFLLHTPAPACCLPRSLCAHRQQHLEADADLEGLNRSLPLDLHLQP